MSRRFIPPAVALLDQGPEAERGRELSRIRSEAMALGQAAGWAEGHASGLAEGLARGGELAEARIADLTALAAGAPARGAIAAAIAELHALLPRALAETERRATEALEAALRHLFPVLLARAAAGEIAALARAALIEHAGELTLRAHPDTLPALAAALGEEAARLACAADATLAPGAAVIDWRGGGVSFDPAALLDAIAAALRPPSSDEDTTR